MTREQNIVRALAIYGMVLPLAIILGYLMANPLQRTSLMVVGGVLLVLVLPIILRFHHPLLFLSWNMTAVVGVLPGRPQFWLVMAGVSMMVSVVQYALTRRVKFVQTRSVLWPLLFIGAVVFGTAMLTGGIGLRVAGGENVGGRRYIIILAGIMGYVAMTAHRIPPGKANLYLGLFILGALTNAVGNLLPYAPKALYPLFAFFPVETQGIASVLSRESVAVHESAVRRFSGMSLGLMALTFFLIARMGLNSLLSLRKPAFWIFIAAAVCSTLGGFRSHLITVMLVVGACFFLEGLHRSRKMPVIVLTLVFVCAGALAFVDRLPISMQRSLTFLPIQVDPVAEMSAKDSSDWRLDMWANLLPEVPAHLALGKGLSISADELDMAETLVNQGLGNSATVAMLAGDYHSGPLSVIIPFGFLGAIGWLWFVGAALRALYLNYQNGDPELKTINTFLFAYFVAKIIMFHAVMGAFDKHLMVFAGLVGFSVALNGGIRKPVPAPETSKQNALDDPLARPRLIPSFPRLGDR